jgi:tetratricopeptide (TPR) repeat protein
VSRREPHPEVSRPVADVYRQDHNRRCHGFRAGDGWARFGTRVDQRISQLGRPTLLTLLLDETMETGDLYSASTHLFHLAELDVWAGDWPSAIEHAEESLQLRQHLDQAGAPLYVEATARACLGDVDRARRVAEAGLAEARRAEDVVFCMQNLHVLGFVELSLGNHEAAQARLGEATDLMRPRWHREFGDCHMVPDEIEALVALGDLARAEDLAALMDEVARATQRACQIGHPVGSPRTGRPANAAASSVALLT